MNVLSPLRDVSNNGEYATPSPSAKGKKSRMFGVSKDENASNPKASTRMKPSLGKTPAASASSMKTPALATTRATPMSTTQKENAKAAKRTLASHAKANAPLKLNDDALKTPNGVGVELNKVNTQNANLRELNNRLISRLRDARSGAERATARSAEEANRRAEDGERLRKVTEDNAALRSLNDKMILHLRYVSCYFIFVWAIGMTVCFVFLFTDRPRRRPRMRKPSPRRPTPHD